ncbi:MAG: CoA transferase [Pseudomonadota bacterium]
MTGILTGMRVVESSAFVAVPLAGMSLAQMGADVIRVDRPSGGLDAGRWPLAPSGQSLFWAGLNKGKKSVTIDTGTPEGRELMTQLVTAPGKDAGIFITNLPAKGWLDHPRLSALRADMITATLKGDRHGAPAVDYTVNPALGVTHITGPANHTDPVAHAIPAWDLQAGQMMVSSVLAAERHRLRTGEGQAVEMSLKDVAASMLGHLGLIGEAALTATPRGKSGNALFGAYGQDFVCACGGRVMVIGLTRRQWSLLVQATGSDGEIAALEQRLGLSLSDEGVRWTHRFDITRIFDRFFATRKISEFADQFDRMGLTWSRVRTLQDALANDADLSAENPVFCALQQPGLGTFPVPGLPTDFGALERQAPKPAPVLGAHTEEVLADHLGLASGQIARLFDKGTAACPEYTARNAA